MTASEANFPGPLYFDASALVELYTSGHTSLRMKDDLSGRTDRFVSDLGVTETASALSRLRREGRMSSADVRRIHTRLLDDIAAGVFERAELSSEVHRATENRLLLSGEFDLRASDALHLGLAIGANCLCMVSYDRRLAAASLQAGLAVYPG